MNYCNAGVGESRQLNFSIADLDIGIIESSVCETEAKFETRLDIVFVKCTVVNVNSLGKVVLWEGIKRYGGVQDIAIIGLVLGDGERKLARRGDISIEDVDKRVSTLLAGQTGEENSGNVGMVDPGINNTNTCVIESANGTMLRCLTYQQSG